MVDREAIFFILRMRKWRSRGIKEQRNFVTKVIKLVSAQIRILLNSKSRHHGFILVNQFHHRPSNYFTELLRNVFQLHSLITIEGDKPQLQLIFHLSSAVFISHHNCSRPFVSFTSSYGLLPSSLSKLSGLFFAQKFKILRHVFFPFLFSFFA